MVTRFTFACAACAALALAACRDSTEADNQDTANPDSRAVEVELPEVPVRYPAVPANARTTMDYAGSYAQTLPGGGQRTISLRDDDTFTLRDENGIESTGTYRWLGDNSRIVLRDGDEDMVFAIADGALYRLPDENTSIDEPKTAEQTFRRVVGPGGAVGASGTVGAGAEAVPDE